MKAYDSVAVTGANTYYSKRIPMTPRSTGVSWHFEWSGTPTGTLTLWGTNKDLQGVQADAAADTDWVQITSFAPTNPAGSASKYGDTSSMAHFRFLRFKYVNSGGTGVLSCDVEHVLNA
jgi:hypothetical protein